MFVGEPFLRKGFPRTPSQKLSHKNHPNRIVSTRIDSRREGEPRFCCRKRLGTAKTLSAKKVVCVGKKDEIQKRRSPHSERLFCLFFVEFLQYVIKFRKIGNFKLGGDVPSFAVVRIEPTGMHSRIDAALNIRG